MWDIKRSNKCVWRGCNLELPLGQSLCPEHQRLQLERMGEVAPEIRGEMEREEFKYLQQLEGRPWQPSSGLLNISGVIRTQGGGISAAYVHKTAMRLELPVQHQGRRRVFTEEQAQQICHCTQEDVGCISNYAVCYLDDEGNIKLRTTLAAGLSSYTPDHVSRLVRNEIVSGWTSGVSYIDYTAFNEYLEAHTRPTIRRGLLKHYL